MECIFEQCELISAHSLCVTSFYSDIGAIRVLSFKSTLSLNWWVIFVKEKSQPGKSSETHMKTWFFVDCKKNMKV